MYTYSHLVQCHFILSVYCFFVLNILASLFLPNKDEKRFWDNLTIGQQQNEWKEGPSNNNNSNNNNNKNNNKQMNEWCCCCFSTDVCSFVCTYIRMNDEMTEWRCTNNRHIWLWLTDWQHVHVYVCVRVFCTKCGFCCSVPVSETLLLFMLLVLFGLLLWWHDYLTLICYLLA